MAQAVLLNAVDVPFTASSLMPDNGLASLAACLAEAGHEALIWDLGTVETVRDHVGPDLRRRVERTYRAIRAGDMDDAGVPRLMALEDEIAEGLGRVYDAAERALDDHISSHGVELLGLKLWIGAGYQEGLRVAANLARRHPRLKVFAGGPLAALAPHRVLQDSGVVRAVCTGEGEETIVGLAEHCDGRRDLASVPNLLIHEGAAPAATERRWCELDSLPRPDYSAEVYPSLARGVQIPILCVNESRGCPMRCPFCAHASISGSRWRVMGSGRVLEQMEHEHRERGVDHFRFSGSYTPGKVYGALARGLLDRGHAFTYSGFAHVNGLRGVDLSLLRRSGLEALFFGVESGCQELLDGALDKRTKVERAGEVLTACMDAGLFVCGSMIHPAPGETEQTAAETEAFLLQLFEGRPRCAVPVLPPLPQPGTHWWDDMAGYGFGGDHGPLLDSLLRRRVRHFLPMNLFEPLPYSLDGRPFNELARQTSRLTAGLRRRGIITNMSDDMVLIAAAAGMEPAELQRRDHQMFVCADADGLEQLILRIG